MADDTDPQSNATDSASSPGSRPPARQAVLDDVYTRAAAIRRRRTAWLGVGGGLAAVVVIASLVAVIPDRGTGSVLTADLADSGRSTTVSEVPVTSGTVFSTATTGSTVETTDTTDLSPPPETNPAPDEDDVVVTLPSDTGPSTTDSAPASSAPEDEGVRIVLVEPEQPKAGEDVTLVVRVVDHDTDLELCGVDWFHGSGAPTTMPPPTCRSKTCGPNDPDPHAEPGKTDRVDTLAPHTYSSPGTYVARVVYEGGQCTPYADRHTAEVTIVVR